MQEIVDLNLMDWVQNRKTLFLVDESSVLLLLIFIEVAHINNDMRFDGVYDFYIIRHLKKSLHCCRNSKCLYTRVIEILLARSLLRDKITFFISLIVGGGLPTLSSAIQRRELGSE